MAKVKTDGHIRGLDYNGYVFHANQTTFFLRYSKLIFLL